MFKNYFKIAIRSLSKQKGLSAINIFGLSAGLACFVLFILYAVNEFNFDSFHKNANNIFRVYKWSEPQGDEPGGASSFHPMPLGPALKQDLSDVEDVVRFQEGIDESFIKVNNTVLREHISFADPQFFSVFTFTLLEGNPSSVLNDVHNVVLNETTARKLFGGEDPVGKTMEIKTGDAFEAFIVTGVAKNMPSNSTIVFNVLANFNYLAVTTGKKEVNNWKSSRYQTFVQLKPNSTLQYDKEKLVGFRQKYYPDEEKKAREKGWRGKSPKVYYGLQPLLAMHTDTFITGGGVPAVAPETIWILLAIAAGVLVIACINFTTLAIGRSASRAREIGVRKVVGGNKKTIVLQFLTEAFVLTFISAALAYMLIPLLLPYFNQLADRQLVFSFKQFPQMIWLLSGVILLVGLLAGSYPALVLSAFKPVEVLRTKVKIGGANLFTKILVMVQFVVSAGLIMCTVIILQQLRYMQSKKPGYNKENVVVVDATGMTDTKKIFALFKQKLSVYPEIKGITSAKRSLGEGEGWSQTNYKYNHQTDKEMYVYPIDNDFLQVMGMQLLAGRNFSKLISSDTVNSIIINETMMKDYGWTLTTAVGQQLKGYSDDATHTPVVIGVVKDFNFLAFSNSIEPQMFHQFASSTPYKFLVRITSGNSRETLAKVQQAWKELVPDYPFKYSFLDDNLNRFYSSEERWSNIIAWAGGISIFLACLGLLGLVALAVVNRSKEIGIRKVFGASIARIFGLLSKDFLKLIAVAFLVAIPAAWYFMHIWLQGYAYRINIQWWVFAVTALATMLAAFITVSFHAIRASVVNPVISLRSE